MNRRHRALTVVVAAIALAGALVLGRPDPPVARANIGCSVATAPAGAITAGIGAITGGAIGGGNPVGDACNAVTDGAVNTVTAPIKSALKGVASGIFGEVTTWVAEGTTWLMGQVVAEIDKTTTPQLTTEGFLAEYARMAQVASILAAAMFVMALLEAVVQGSWSILGRAIFVSVPLAFVGTSIAFVLVQLMLVVTDGMSHAVTVATQEDSTQFFKTSIVDLAKAGGKATGAAAEATGSPGAGGAAEVVGATSAVAGPAPDVPLFVTFIAAIVGAFAAFCVWFELWLRDASVYVIVLFMPLAAAASISPRWAHVLRRYIEVIVTVIGSKFVIVSVVALAASLASEVGASFEHIISAAALLLVACFVPAVFFRLVLSTEGAVTSALSRRGVVGGAVVMAQVVGGPQGFAHMARSNWKGPQVWSVEGGAGPGGDQGQGGGPGTPGGPGSPPGKGGGPPAPLSSGGATPTASAPLTVAPIASGAETPPVASGAISHHVEDVTAAGAEKATSPGQSSGSSFQAPTVTGHDGAPPPFGRQGVPDPATGGGPRQGPGEAPPRPPEHSDGTLRPESHE